ncbi:MAG: hypothetical protein WCH75_17530, partial [Candidatus Binatia bacterium]
VDRSVDSLDICWEGCGRQGIRADVKLSNGFPSFDFNPTHGMLDGIKYLDTGRPEWIQMKPILDVVNEALKAAGKN